MSEGTTIALIGFAGAVLGAAITGFAAIEAAGLRGKSEGGLSCGLLGLVASIGAAGGLIAGAIFGTNLVQSPPKIPLATQQPLPVVQPTPTTRQSTQEPILTITPPIQPTAKQQVIYNCPKYQETGKRQSFTITISVPSGEIAFVDAWGFDNRSGGIFVTITGPYSGQHTITDGAYCYGISVNVDYAPVREQRIRQLPTPHQEIFLP